MGRWIWLKFTKACSSLKYLYNNDYILLSMKQTIKLTESELKAKIQECINRILKENRYQCAEPYYKLTEAADEFINALYEDFDVNNSEDVKSAITALKNAIDQIDRVVNHPEGRDNNVKIWHSVGF